jgi:hypothetical protein
MWGCADTDGRLFILMCPEYFNLTRFDCNQFAPRYTSVQECLARLPVDRDGAQSLCTLGIIHSLNLEAKSDAPFSGGVCVVNC